MMSSVETVRASPGFLILQNLDTLVSEFPQFSPYESNTDWLIIIGCINIVCIYSLTRVGYNWINPGNAVDFLGNQGPYNFLKEGRLGGVGGQKW